MTCIVFSPVWNTVLNYTLRSIRSDPVFKLCVFLSLVSISCLWKWLTGEAGVDPILNVGNGLLAPYLTEAYWQM